MESLGKHQYLRCELGRKQINKKTENQWFLKGKRRMRLKEYDGSQSFQGHPKHSPPYHLWQPHTSDVLIRTLHRGSFG